MNIIRLFLLLPISSLLAPTIARVAQTVRGLRWPRWLRRLQLFVALSCMAAVAAAATSPLSPMEANEIGNAGWLETRAEVLFYAEDDVRRMRVLSNVVAVELAAVRALAFSHVLEAPALAGQAFAIPLTLLNQGNVATAYRLRIQDGPNGTLALLPDVDGNGVKHAGVPALDLDRPRLVQAGGQEAFLLTGVMPADAGASSRYAVVVRASTLDGAIVADAALTLAADTAPQMRVSLEARPAADDADRVVVTARIANSGMQTLAAGKTVNVDGRLKETTLLRYRIPDGMRYVGSVWADGVDASAFLFAARGDPEFQYSTVASENVGEIGLSLDKPLRAGESRRIIFELQREKDAARKKILSRAEAYDSAALRAVVSNIVAFEPAAAASPDLAPVIRQSDTGLGDASTWIEIGVDNLGAAATEGFITIKGEVPAAPADLEIDPTNWQCTVRRTASGSAFQCGSADRLPAGASMPPILINVARDASGTQENRCGLDKIISATVSVPNEAQTLTDNNRAEAALLCKNGAVISGRAWIDAANDGVYRHGAETLRGWRAQLLRAGQIVKEAKTDAQGRYRIVGVLPDRGYSLRFLSPQGRIEAPPVDGAIDAVTASSVLRSERDFVRGELHYDAFLFAREYTDQNLALLPTGVVFNEDTREPIANAKVTLQGPQGFNPDLHLLGAAPNLDTVTDEQGRFNFFLTPDAPGGIYRWRVRADGYEMPRDSGILELTQRHTGSRQAGLLWSVYKVFPTPDIPLFSAAASEGEQNGGLRGAGEAGAGTQAERGNGYFAMNRVRGARKVVNNHLGMHPLMAGGELTLQKSADKQTVEQIDFFHYTLKLSHRRATAFAGFSIDDDLPRGLRYVPGSARLVDARSAGMTGVQAAATVLPDPAMREGKGAGGGVSRLHFDFSATPLPPNVPLQIRYRVAVGATAPEGVRLVSHARAAAGAETAQASAAIRVSGGVFSEDAFVLGRVFVDCNGNGRQDAGEPGVPGVRLYLEDGSFAETDRRGKYSLYGLTPSTHVLKMDALSLPASARAQVLSHRQAGRGDLRFLDVRDGELGRADFALACDPGVLAEVAYRAARLAQAGDELDSALKLRFDAEVKPDAQPPALQGERAAGWIGEEGGRGRAMRAGNAATPSVPSALSVPSSEMTPAAGKKMAVPPPAALDTLLRGDTALRIVNLQDGAILASDFTDVTVLGHDGSDFALCVNGQAVPARQVGQRSALASRHAAAWTYVAVRLHSGRNALEVTQQDGGQVRRQRITVTVPGPVARLTLTAPSPLLADGQSPIALHIALFDRDGIPATAPALLSLAADGVQWLSADANPDLRGQQVLVRDGHATVLLKAPAQAGERTVRAELGRLRQRIVLRFGAALRPMVAAGIVEGMITLNTGKIESGGASGPTGFERALRSFARSSGDGRQGAAARSAFFLKGQVKGEYLLTAAFDSDKQARDRLFRDIEPDKYYPVYGDDALRGFDAQASSKLYLRIDHERSYLVLGDFNTGRTGSVRQLTQYSRAVNGVHHHLEQGALTVNAFASRDNLRQQVITFPAANTRFYPGKLPESLVEGSERVDIVTYDRAQGGIGQKVRTLTRFADYTIDALSGSLQVVDAVTRIDADTGGENVYRIVFEVEEGAAQSWLYGGDIAVKPGEAVTLGALAVNDDNANQPRRLRGVFGRWQAGPQTQLDGEIAYSEVGEDLTRAGAGAGTGDGLGSSGSGWRVGARHQEGALATEVAVVSTSDGFDNRSAPVQGGRFEARAKGRYRIDDKTALKAEALRTRERLNGGLRYGGNGGSAGSGSGFDGGAALETVPDQVRYNGALLGVERALGAGVKAELGTRVVRGRLNRGSGGNSGNSNNSDQGDQGGEEEIDLITLRTRVGAAVPGLAAATVYGEYERDVRTSRKQALALGAEYALPHQGRLYARHEFISSLGSAYALEEGARSYRTLIGVEGDYTEGGQAFSEYRGARPLTGRAPEAAYGTRNRWQINERLSLRSSVERTQSLARGHGGGRAGATASSLSTVLQYRHSAALKGSTGLDVRVGESETSYLSTLGVGYRLDEEWTLLGKNAVYLVRGKSKTPGAGASAANGAERDLLRTRQRLGLAYRQAHGHGLNALGYYEHRSSRSGAAGADNERAHIVSLHANGQPARHWEVSGRYAGKYKTMDGRNGRSRIAGQLLSGRVTRDIGRKWDGGIAASLFADSLGQRKQALGVEAGYLVKDDLWLSAGYNVVGFTDRDFAGMADTAQGVYFRLRYKFDENSF